MYQTQVDLKTGKVEAIDVDLTKLPVRLKVTAGRRSQGLVGGKGRSSSVGAHRTKTRRDRQ